jgi:TPR repeat protein
MITLGQLSFVGPRVLPGCYRNGDCGPGLARDEKDSEAARLFWFAVYQGNAAAQFNLGVFYEDGDCGLAKDEKEAARLYRLAADQGNRDADALRLAKLQRMA